MRFYIAILSSLFFLGLVGLAGLFLLISYFSHDLPDYKYLKDYQPSVVSRLYAGNGALLSEYADEKRIFVPANTIPERVIDAFVSAEDKSFFSHHGLDYRGIVAAIITNVRHAHEGKRPIGASTITQQVAKNMLLGNEVSLRRKVREAILATRLEQTLSKERILEIYLNEIFLGNRSYGVAAAALNWFNKSLDELTTAEAAYLASLPKGPNNYHPIRNQKAAYARRNWAIDRMTEDGKISKEEAAAAKEEPLTARDSTDINNIGAAEYFSEEVRRQLAEKYGEKKLYEEGLAVRTSLDPRLQEIGFGALRTGLFKYEQRHGWRGSIGNIANIVTWQQELAKIHPAASAKGWQMAVVLETSKQEARIGLDNGKTGKITLTDMNWARKLSADGRLGATPTSTADVLKKGDVIYVEASTSENTPAENSKESNKVKASDLFSLRQIPQISGALVALDPHTGRVLALVGGLDFAHSQYNRATQAARQPGSSFKPFVYLAALDSGYTPSTLILDEPASFSQGAGMPLWKPENYTNDFLGPTPLRVGIEKSRNLMTVRLANDIGMKKVAEYAARFGINDHLPLNLAMALGAGETTLLKLTGAYGMLVNGGKKITPSLIDRIQDRNGNTLYRQDQRQCQDCRGISWVDQTPPTLSDIREQIADPRTTYQMVSILEGVVQRGTATILKKLNRPLAGKTGTTNDSKDVWFVGFTPDLVVGVFVGYDEPKTLGAKETGGKVAAPIFGDFIAEALKNTPPTPFRTPAGLRLVRVNPHNGQLAAANDKNAIWEGFIPGTEPGAQTVNSALPTNPTEQFNNPPSANDIIPTPPDQPATTSGTGGLY
ncbi:MAG: penicillin-binding protein 1A [Alphaproteobacteria bacterium]